MRKKVERVADAELATMKYSYDSGQLWPYVRMALYILMALYSYGPMYV